MMGPVYYEEGSNQYEEGVNHLGQVDDGARVGAADVADVGEGEGAPLEVGGLELARLGVRLQARQLDGHLRCRRRAWGGR